MGVRIDGVDKISYVHLDAYPGGLGEDIVSDIRAMLHDFGLEEIKTLARQLRLVDKKDVVSLEDQKKFATFADRAVSTGSPSEWYVLLRTLQGDLRGTLLAGVMIENASFLAESLYCEWAYIVNLDEETFEVYQGFQRKAHTYGRYAQLTPPRNNNYYPVALLATFPLRAIPGLWANEENLVGGTREPTETFEEKPAPLFSDEEIEVSAARLTALLKQWETTSPVSSNTLNLGTMYVDDIKRLLFARSRR
jgi:hypothetical protein